MTGSRMRALAAVVLLAASQAFAAECVPPGAWRAPGPDGPRPVSGPALVSELARRDVVLLGERHDSAEHHRWQLQVITALHAVRPDLVIALEMFPRRVQPALDRWVAGELSEIDFLRESDWREVWQMDPQLYLPIFHFARMNNIPMVAANVDRALTHAVREKGFDAVPDGEREGVDRPAAASNAYLEFLREIYREHVRAGDKSAPDATQDDPAFRRFVETQLVWDRALAQRIATALRRTPRPLVVGVVGGGHAVNRFGIPHQLDALGIQNVAVLAPWDAGTDCKKLVAGYADAVFGVAVPAGADEPRRMRLGVWLEPAAGAVRIIRVEPGSVAEAAGLRAGDVVVEVAGVAAKQTSEMADVVKRQAPGTWLPLKIKRGADTTEIVAKFPPSAP
jgi:uncharacterized iron-regulated protein